MIWGTLLLPFTAGLSWRVYQKSTKRVGVLGDGYLIKTAKNIQVWTVDYTVHTPQSEYSMEHNHLHKFNSVSMVSYEQQCPGSLIYHTLEYHWLPWHMAQVNLQNIINVEATQSLSHMLRAQFLSLAILPPRSASEYRSWASACVACRVGGAAGSTQSSPRWRCSSWKFLQFKKKGHKPITLENLCLHQHQILGGGEP